MFQQNKRFTNKIIFVMFIMGEVLQKGDFTVSYWLC